VGGVQEKSEEIGRISPHSSSGPAISSVYLLQRLRRKISEDAKIEDGHNHRFRDTFATTLLQAGVSIQDVSVFLGHRSVKITEKHYAPWVKTWQDALNRLFERVAVEEPA